MLIHLLFLLLLGLYYIRYNQRKPYHKVVESDNNVWGTIGTYYPMIPIFSDNGDIYHNLWAKGGCLDKFDKWMRNKYDIKTNARRYEKQPFFNWLIDKPAGYFIPQKSIESTNFEVTSGVNINQNKILDSNITYSLENIGVLNKDKIESWWWGSCDLIAKASQLYKEPTKIVVDSDVVFLPHDIKGLLSIISTITNHNYEKISFRYSDTDDSVILTTGEKIDGKIETKLSDINHKNIKKNNDDYLIKNIETDIIIVVDGSKKTIPKEDINFIKHESYNDLKAIDFHNYAIKWLSENRPFSLDIDKNSQVWNYSYDKIEINEIPVKDLNFEQIQIYKDIVSKYNLLYKVRILNCIIFKSDNKSENYIYWIVEDWKNTIIGSGWISSVKPDFMWRCELKPNWKNIKENPRNPDVTPYYVNQLYQQSI